MTLGDFIERGAEAVGITLSDLKARKRGASIAEGREILAWLGVELYGFTVKEIAEDRDKHLETVSRLREQGGDGKGGGSILPGEDPAGRFGHRRDGWGREMSRNNNTLALAPLLLTSKTDSVGSDEVAWACGSRHRNHT